jgi:hypothetical protein
VLIFSDSGKLEIENLEQELKSIAQTQQERWAVPGSCRLNSSQKRF